jgi:ABC-type dipeptide/oligopeptide/nickel transport system permease component
MIKQFTPNDLIRYIYQEMNEVEQDLLVQALHSDESLMQEYVEMLSTLDQLDQIQLSPSEKVVKAIKSKATLRDFKESEKIW